jgi:23S rRNA (uracil1939-C5)-methyltransferase
MVVDPPRAGLTKKLITKLAILNFRSLIYVSCNPATFARDIKLFEEKNIELIKVQPIDMFPQTHHIECVGLLKRKV